MDAALTKLDVPVACKGAIDADNRCESQEPANRADGQPALAKLHPNQRGLRPHRTKVTKRGTGLVFFVSLARCVSIFARSRLSFEFFLSSRSIRRVRLLTLSGPNPNGSASYLSVVDVTRRINQAAAAQAK